MPVAKRCASRGILSWPMSLSFGWGGDVATIYTPQLIHQNLRCRDEPSVCSSTRASDWPRFERGLAALALHRVRGVRLDLERADGFRSGHARGRVPALLDVVVGDDLVLLLAAEAGVPGQRVAEARGQPVIVAAEALAQVEEPGEGEPAVGRRHHLLGRHVPAGDGPEDGERLVVLVGEEVTEADLVAEAVAVAGLAHVIAARGREQVRSPHHRHVTRVVRSE